MKDKTCAAYVCAFLLIAICVTAFVLSDSKEASVQPVDGELFEQTSEPLTERENTNGVTLAELPKSAAKKEPEAVIVPGNADAKKSPAAETAVPDAFIEPPELKAELPYAEPSVGTDISVQEKLVKEVFETAEVKTQEGRIVVSYSQPEIPPAYHLTVKAEVYDKKGATVCRYVSDGGWLSDPSKYDSAEKDVLEAMGIGDLNDKMFILVVKVGDANLAVGATVWQLTQHYDGTRSIESAYVQ